MDRSSIIVGGVILLAAGYGLLRAGGWFEERLHVSFVGAGALFPYALIVAGLVALARGLLGL